MYTGMSSENDDTYLTTEYEFDSWMRVVRTIDSTGHNSGTITYDLNGNVITSTDANGNITTNTYDALNRLISSDTINPDDSSKNVSKSYKYDEMGRTTQTTVDGHSTLYLYDDLGRVYQEEGYNAFKGFKYVGISQYPSYETSGIFHKLLYYEKDYEYDDEMRVINVRETGKDVVSYTYDANGNKKSETLGNGVVSTYTYNNANKITKLENKSGDMTISGYEYSYYLDGSDACKVRSKNGIIETTEYKYDGLKRLTEESVKVGDNTTDTYKYEYDDYSNRSKMTASGSEDYVTEYSYVDSDGKYTALLQKETKTVQGENNALNNSSNVKQTFYTYDANGNQITKTADGKTETNTYDGLNQLIGFTDGETTASYTYDVNGLRLSKTVNGVKTTHIWIGNQIAVDYTGSYTSTVYLRGTSLTAAFNWDEGYKGDYRFYTQNAHGDVVNLTDENGGIAKSYTYDAFGVEKNIDDSDTNPFRYCGEYFDAETGTIYFRSRYYSPTTGRFISRDSVTGKIDDPLSLNLYTYCYNNPIIGIDPNGHMCFCFGFDICFGTDVQFGLEYTLPNSGFLPKIGPLPNTENLSNIGNIPIDFVGPIAIPEDFSKNLIIEKDLDQAKEVEAEDTDEKQGHQILYHYTNRKNLLGILTSQVLWLSLKSNNPNDARYGNGQYFTDLNPYLYNSSQIAQKLISWPNKYKYNSYIAIDVTGLQIDNLKENFYVHRSEIPLDISGRIVVFGTVSMKKKE